MIGSFKIQESKAKERRKKRKPAAHERSYIALVDHVLLTDRHSSVTARSPYSLAVSAKCQVLVLSARSCAGRNKLFRFSQKA
jgi:hypothetical protein